MTTVKNSQLPNQNNTVGFKIMLKDFDKYGFIRITNKLKVKFDTFFYNIRKGLFPKSFD